MRALRRWRYLVITELFLPTRGGSAVWFDEVYRRIGDKGTHIVTAAVPGAALHDAAHPNTIHRVPLRRHRWLRPESFAMYAKLFLWSSWVILRYRLDVVHAGRVLPEGLAAWVVARLRCLPFLVYAHGEEITTWRQRWKFRAMRFVYQHADCVIANSEFTRGELLELGVSSANINVLYPGVDVNRFRPGLPSTDLRARLGIGEKQRLILSVGRLSRRKGFDQIIRVLPDLVSQGFDVHYAIIGIGKDREYLISLADEQAITRRVHSLGHISETELPRWYSACDVFAMPNRDINGDTEGFGMVFLEAAACAKPALAGNSGGTAAAVVDGVTGLRANGEDKSAIAEALASLLGNPSWARQLGQEGRVRACKSFSWQRVAEATVALALVTGV
jgi:phosphatidylinositol alpha-1,6-mannosyltransferase